MKERWAVLLRVISLMDDDDRILLGLRFAAERTNREIAAVLSLSEAAVSMRLLRTLRRLRELLMELGVS
jgi:RNA polymerase sigma factor (sigma-70 family)